MSEHTQGAITTILNHQKGIWCEYCGDNCTSKHLIRIEGEYNASVELVCVTCATNLIVCLRHSLMEALLTDKERT